MFGYLRFILAFLVMLSHIDIRFFGLNPGVIAVVIFYILAGFVVSHLYNDIIPKKNRLFSFYKDRFLRIYPLYAVVLVMTLLFLSITGYADPHFTFSNLLNNITVIPLNYYMYIDSAVLTNPSWWLIPPAWSLGTELQAYLLLPFALMFKRVKYTLIVLTLIVYTMANLSLIHADYFGYRLIVGVFFVFLAGAAVQSYKKADRYYLALLWLGMFLSALLFGIKGSFSPAYAKETYLGLLIGIPLVLLLSKTKLKLPLNTTLGNLSYALFLTHFLAIWILNYMDIPSSKTYIYLFLLISVTLLLSALALYIAPSHRRNYKGGSDARN